MKKCTETDCNRRVHAKGLCPLHYQRARKEGSLPEGVSLADRFWPWVDKNGPVPTNVPGLGDCWVWTRYQTPLGYGQMSVDNKRKLTHRIAYELEYGPIPDGKVVDHKCRNPSCVRPDHLSVVTQKQNNENQGLARNNKSGYRGVSKHTQCDSWVVYVNDNGKTVYGGSYKTPEEANEAAIQLRRMLYTHSVDDMILEENDD